MYRRQYLGFVGTSAAAATAGCSSILSNGGDDDLERSDYPRITDFGPVTKWTRVGDLEEHRETPLPLSELEGGRFGIAFAYEVWAADDVVDTLEEVTIQDDDGASIATRENDGQRRVDDTGPTSIEHALFFTADVLEPGSRYSASVEVRDRVEERASETRSTEFGVVE